MTVAVPVEVLRLAPREDGDMADAGGATAQAAHRA